MSNFIGSKCIVCEKLFEKDDDIVVCPECGTPYHRECYLKEGKCVNTELHETNSSWKPEETANVQNGEVICKACGTHNNLLSMFCKKCGSPLIKVDEEKLKNAEEFENSIPQSPFNSASIDVNLDSPTCGLNPEEEFDEGNSNLKEIATAVGSNTHYFIPIFKRFKDTGKKIFPNFIAFILPEFYCAYRKMFLPMIIMTILSAINFFISVIFMTTSSNFDGMFTSQYMIKIFGDYEEAIYNISIVTSNIQFVLRLLMGLFINYYYYRHTLNTIKKVKNNNNGQSPEAVSNMIREKGGISTAALIVLVVLELSVNFIAAFLIVWSNMTA